MCIIIMYRYKLINFPLSLYVAPTAKNCEMILEKIGVEKYAIGKTKVSRAKQTLMELYA